jgi:hypothetical protein
MSAELTYADSIRTSSVCGHVLRCIKPLAKCSLLPALLRQIVSKMSLCMYVYMCVHVLSVRACMQAFAPRVVLFLTPQLRASISSHMKQFHLILSTDGSTQSVSHLRQRGMYQGLADREKVTHFRKEF